MTFTFFFLKSSKKFEFLIPGKFDLKNTVINIVAGLGLLSFITMFCDFILLNYVSERSIVRSSLSLLILYSNQRERGDFSHEIASK